MTSAAEAALQMDRALSTSEQKLSELKEYADFLGIPREVVNRLTRLELKMTHMFTRTIQILAGLLETILHLETLTEQQHAAYREIMVLKNAIDLYESCKHDPAKMLQWVRGFSALWIVSEAMSQNGIKSGVFGGDEGVLHFGRPSWSGDSNKYGNVLSSMNLLIQKMAKWAGFQQGKNQEVEDLLFQARLDNLREDPLKLTAIDRLVQAFADDANRKFLDALPAAGTKQCPGA
jgi:hypothetical protein